MAEFCLQRHITLCCQIFRSLIKKHLPVLYSDSDLKSLFPENSISTVFKKNRNVKDILSPSLYAKNKKNRSFMS